MKTVHKFPVKPGRNELRLPRGAVLLTIQMQRGAPCLWALLDTDNEEERRVFWVGGTGHEYPPSLGRHIATFQMETEGLVWHAFELLPGSVFMTTDQDLHDAETLLRDRLTIECVHIVAGLLAQRRVAVKELTDMKHVLDAENGALRLRMILRKSVDYVLIQLGATGRGGTDE